MDVLVLVEIEKEHLRGFDGMECERRLFIDNRRITPVQDLPIERNLAFGHMDPGVTAGGKLMRDSFVSANLASQRSAS